MNTNLFLTKKIQKVLDNSPLLLDYNDDQHILIFRRLIERSMYLGLWSGEMAQLS